MPCLCIVILLVKSIVCLSLERTDNIKEKIAEILPNIKYEFVYEKAVDDKPTILFLHGFPSSLHAWRHQLKYFSGKGYGCLVPNLLGYGQTYSPLNENEYSSKKITDHLLALLNYVGLNKTKVYVVGHDWGSRTASRFVLYHPERTIGAVLISVAYSPPVQFNLDLVLNQTVQTVGYESIGYWRFFKANDAATIIENKLDSFIDLLFANDSSLVKTHLAPGNKIREWVSTGNRTIRATYMTKEDYDIIYRYLNRSMQPKLNWFKAMIANVDWDYEKNLNSTVQRPVLFIEGQNETIGIIGAGERQRRYITNLTIVQLPNTGHWVMEQRPDEVNKHIDQWMKHISTSIDSAATSFLLSSSIIFSLMISFYNILFHE